MEGGLKKPDRITWRGLFGRQVQAAKRGWLVEVCQLCGQEKGGGIRIPSRQLVHFGAIAEGEESDGMMVSLLTKVEIKIANRRTAGSDFESDRKS